MMLRGLVLAGGQSKRFGHDKALALHQGKTFVEIAVSLLKEAGVEPLVVTREEADYSFLKCRILKDKLRAKGPLGGIYSAMSAYPNNRFLVLTCDMPALPVSALLDLIAQESSDDIIAYTNGDAVQPFPGIYSSSLLEPIILRLLREDYSMKSLIEDTPNSKLLYWQGDTYDLANVNHPEDTLLLNPLTA